MVSIVQPPSRSGRVALLSLLAALVALPALTVVVGISGGRVVFALYREPKLAAFMVLGWVLFTAFCWTRRKHLNVTPWLAISRRPEVLLLLVLLAYMALTLCWTLVPENGLYEISQYGVLIALVFCLIIWSHDDEAVVSVVRWSLILSIGAATLIGLLQMAGWFSFLPPINPYEEVGYPSLMGYKNPMALAVLGQLFVLAGCIHAGRSTRALTGQALLWCLLFVEVFYLVTLLSRSSLVGLVLGTLFLALLQLITWQDGRRLAVGSVVLPAMIACVVIAAVMLNSSARDKVRSVAGYLSHPATILESDRGIFALNTITMVRSHPFGVGIGDWQSNYPVYRTHGRYFNFTDEKQLRRAHSDHVQMLGEVGWPGLALWLAFLGTLIWRTARDGVRRKSISSQFLAAQLVAMSAARSWRVSGISGSASRSSARWSATHRARRRASGSRVSPLWCPLNLSTTSLVVFLRIAITIDLSSVVSGSRPIRATAFGLQVENLAGSWSSPTVLTT